MQRTIRIQLQPDIETAKVLSQTIEQYTWSFNAVCRHGWETGIGNGVELHKATYYDHRAMTGLPAQLVCAARVKATEALRSARSLEKKGKTVSCPTSKRCPIRYDARSYTVWFDRQQVSILSINGRVKLSFEVAEYYRQYLNWKNTSADLLQDRKGRWWLHIVVEIETPETGATNEVVGVDLGIASPAVDSRGSKYGSVPWKGVEDRTFELRRRLQSKGTKSAKRHLKKLSGRQRCFRKDCDHVLSKRLVRSVEKGATLVFEDLTNIRGRAKMRKAQRRRLHGWSFNQFQAFVTYKAEARGVNVGFVDPRYTSQKCSQCGHIERGNRPSQAEFRCKKCGYECHADYNAAINIREDFLKLGAAVNQPIVVCPEMGT
ncbi:MAG: IS200/IS605 family element transposase accessory protein TnpB [Cyanobacteria bacterium CRU_2_1]|nr:IS200/IS605 family element transposase accessory protein TnpB [Cyanobacteria bacterium RU_5_0]NJR59547.1 IS200/IS605 family element transposase accessory protein TnpB [Cyanobacteria bacterium CRU_2_1]